MRKATRKLLLVSLAGLVAGLAVVATAAGKRVDVDAFSLIGGDPTVWDGALDDYFGGEGDVDACYIRDSYTPVVGGASFEGRRMRRGMFAAGGMFGLAMFQIGIHPASGEGEFNRRKNELSVGPAVVNGLTMTRRDRAVGPWLRTLVKMRNGEPTVYSDVVSWDSALTPGAATGTTTSSGDATLTPADRWLVLGGTDEAVFGYQTVGFALHGKGARAPVSAVLDGPPDCVTVDYAINVPPGATRYMLLFTEQHTTVGAGKRSIKQYNRRHLSRKLLNGIPKKVRRKVLNWDL